MVREVDRLSLCFRRRTEGHKAVNCPTINVADIVQVTMEVQATKNNNGLSASNQLEPLYSTPGPAGPTDSRREGGHRYHHRGVYSEANLVRDCTSMANIWVCGEHYISKNSAVLLTRLTWVKVAEIRVYNCYLPLSDSIEEFERSLDAIAATATSSTLPVAIGGDFNAWATEWGRKTTNNRGRTLFEVFAILELEFANIGTMPTYTKGGKSSIIDLTFVDTRFSREDSYWQVSGRYTGSDYRALRYQLHPKSRTANMTQMLKKAK